MEIKDIIEKTQSLDRIRDSIKQAGTMIDYGIWYELMNISSQNDKIITLLETIANKDKIDILNETKVEEEPKAIVKKEEIKINTKK